MKFKELYETIQKTAEKEQNLLNKTYPERIRVVDKKGGLICAIDADSTKWIKMNHAYLWDLDVISNDSESFIDSDSSCNIEDWTQITVDCESEKDGAMKVIEMYCEYLNISKILNDLGIDSGNFYRGKVGIKKLSLLINTVKQSPIKIKKTVN